MHHYVNDLSLFDYNYNYYDPLSNPFSHRHTSLNDYEDDYYGVLRDESKPGKPNGSPPKYRHDGKSPLPLGMDWSPPPRKWDGRDTVWPNGPHTGWSYCVTVPSWGVQPKSSGSDPVVVYRVQVGIRSPEGITTTRNISRRFNDFLQLFSELKKEFPSKNLPPAPPKRRLRIKSQTLLEERIGWKSYCLKLKYQEVLPVAIFLELEAAARSSFHDVNQQIWDATSSVSGAYGSSLFQSNSDAPVNAYYSSMASDHGHETPYEVSELGTPWHGNDTCADPSLSDTISEQDPDNPTETIVRHGELNRDFTRESAKKYPRHNMHTENEHREDIKLDGHVRRLSTESVGSDLSSAKASEILNLAVTNALPEGSEAPRNMDYSVNSDLQFSSNLLVALPSDERHKLNRLLVTLQRRLTTAKTDTEDLLARLNQEVAVRQFLTTKVKDLEVELETTRLNCRENIQQAVLAEKERFTQMQWDIEELRRNCLEMELKLKIEEDERMQAELNKASIIQENEMLLKELEVARRQLESLQKHHNDFEVKSKADVKLLIKEVKSLRSSEVELKQELSQLMKEKLEVERALYGEKQRLEHSNNANAKLLHECEILRNRLQECSVNFLVEEEDKLTVDSSSPSDALDLLATSDNRIGLLIAEAQLLAQDVQNGVAAVDETPNVSADDRRTTDSELKKMLTEIFVDNATLRKQVNSVIRCALNANIKSEEEDEEEEIILRKTVLSKFLER
ncbi:Phox (PX) domain protein [Quillaja saponaria]|uniref:Phox (PX) domain protein n=1 Tax=Quillaja saponaria TaxID=32244 RepID=A0AAD7PQ77_QUISA|nr:Phox (PX) domain protein [Quillaja saponaria]